MFIYQNTYRVWYDCLEPKLPSKFKQEGLIWRPEYMVKILDFCIEYTEWLAEALSINGEVSVAQVKYRLKALNKEYSTFEY